MILTMTLKPNRIQNFDINTDRSITKLWGHDAFIVAFLDFSGKRSRKNNLFGLQVQEVRKQNPNRQSGQSLIQEKGNARIAKKPPEHNQGNEMGKPKGTKASQRNTESGY